MRRLRFEANRGQADDAVRYVARLSEYAALVSDDGLLLRPSGGRDPSGIRLRFTGATTGAIAGSARHDSSVSYFHGSDPAQWIVGAPVFERVTRSDLYPGIDLVYYGHGNRLEYDLVVSAGADPKIVSFEVEGGEGLRLDADGDLTITTATGEFTLEKPVVYQDIDGARRRVDGRYELAGARQVRFSIGTFETDQPLVIDPIIVFASYLGGLDNDFATDVAVDADGNSYITGMTNSFTFPSAPGHPNGFSDAFVTKIDPTGTRILYSAHIGGSGLDNALAVAVDGVGQAYLTGYTQAANFPLVQPLQNELRGGIQNAFVVKLAADGSTLLFSSYLGDSGLASEVALDQSHNIWVRGAASFGSGPYVAKINTGASGSALLFYQHVPGALTIDVDGHGAAYVAGSAGPAFTPINAAQGSYGGGDTDAFVMKIEPMTVAAPTFDDNLDAENGAIASSPYDELAKWTVSRGTVDLLAYADGLMVRNALDASGATLESRSLVTLEPNGTIHPAANHRLYRLDIDFVGAEDVAPGLVTVSLGAAFSETFMIPGHGAGVHISRDLVVSAPVSSRIQIDWPTGEPSVGLDAIRLSTIDETPTVAYATWLGGSGFDAIHGVAAAADGSVFVTGRTNSTNFPAVAPLQPNPGGGLDVFVSRLSPSGAALAFSTIFGGTGDDEAFSIDADGGGNVVVVGATTSDDFPLREAIQAVRPGTEDGFALKIRSTGELAYSTYLGGSDLDRNYKVALDDEGDAYIVSATSSTDLDTVNPLQAENAGNNDAFVIKLSDIATARLFGTSINSGGNTGLVSLNIFGANLANVSSVKFVGASTEITAERTTLVGSSAISATFNLTGAAAGVRDIVVTLSDGTVLTLLARFRIEDGGASEPWVKVIGRDAIRPGVPQTYYVAFGNRGNIDEENEHFIVLNWPASAALTIDGAIGAYGLPAPPPIVEDSIEAVDIFLGRIPAGSSGFFKARLTTANDVPVVTLGASIVSMASLGAPLTTADVTGLASFGLAAAVDLFVAPDETQNPIPPNGATVFLGADKTNPFGHLGVVKSDCHNPNGCTTGDYFVLDPFRYPGMPMSSSNWIGSFPGARPLGWGIPPGWTPGAGNRAEQVAGELLSAGRATPWVPDGKNLRGDDKYSCAGFAEFVYEQAGLNPTLATEGDPFVIFPGAKYRQFTGKNDFYGPELVGSAAIHGLQGFSLAFGNFIAALRGLNLVEDFVVRNVTSVDPNEKVGAAGIGAPRYIAGTQQTQYAIFFENLETALAPAQEVVITDALDLSKYDLDTFSLGPIAFGDRSIVPPSGQQALSTEVDLRPSNNLVVRVTGGLDKTTGVVSWRFRSIDPDTGLPPEDPLAGFLPPNVMRPAGEGSVLFVVQPKASLAHGTAITNSASIVFDTNAAIATNVWSNTIDSAAPVSQVTHADPAAVDGSFRVEWSGTDEGSGVRDFTVFVSVNGGEYAPWLLDTTTVSAVFAGAFGYTYDFYTVARDKAGNREAPPPVPDLSVVTTDTTAPALIVPVDLTVNATNPAGAIVTYSVTATDNADPAPAIDCTPGSGSVFPIASSTVHCTATDSSGNASNAQFRVSVVGAEAQLRNLLERIQSMALPTNINAAISALLRNALSAHRQQHSACGMLEQVVHLLQVQGKRIATDAGNQLIADITRIRNVMACR